MHVHVAIVDIDGQPHYFSTLSFIMSYRYLLGGPLRTSNGPPLSSVRIADSSTGMAVQLEDVYNV
jgi:hypothetical protein